MSATTMKELLEAGVHFGHQTKRWNPKMKRYIYGGRNGIYIIDLHQTLKMFEDARKFIQGVVENNQAVLFVGTKKQAQELMIYHGVLTSCNGFVYSFGAALLDLEEPWKVIHRTAPYIFSPQAPYELAGDVPNVTFPCAALTDAPTGRIAIYYGAADTATGLAFCQVDELIAFIKENRME